MTHLNHQVRAYVIARCRGTSTSPQVHYP